MRLLHEVGGPRQDIAATISQDDQVVLLLEPQTDPFFAAPPVAPYLDGRITVMFDDRPWPADSFTATEIGRALFFRFAFLDQMPEGRFLALGKRMPFETEPSALKYWLAVDEIQDTTSELTDLAKSKRAVSA